MLPRGALRVPSVAAELWSTEEVTRRLTHGTLWAQLLLSGTPAGRGWGRMGLTSGRADPCSGDSWPGGGPGAGSRLPLWVPGADGGRWKKSAFRAQPHKLEKPGPELAPPPFACVPLGGLSFESLSFVICRVGGSVKVMRMR